MTPTFLGRRKASAIRTSVPVLLWLVVIQQLSSILVRSLADLLECCKREIPRNQLVSGSLRQYPVELATGKGAVPHYLRGTFPERTIETYYRVSNPFPRRKTAATPCPTWIIHEEMDAPTSIGLL